jgi:hypothetical protein
MFFNPLKFQDHCGEYWASNMFLIACRTKIKVKCSFSTFNRKILNLTILIVCRKNLRQSNHTDCKIITLEGGKKFFGGEP